MLGKLQDGDFHRQPFQLMRALRRGRRREGLPPEVLAELDETERVTAEHTGLTLCLALNYGSRTELADAARALAFEVATGRLAAEDIDESAIARCLYTAGISDPDLLVRTAGEMRISNYLLWQISYAELEVTDVLWPDFSVDELHGVIREFARRERRYGAVLPPRS